MGDSAARRLRSIVWENDDEIRFGRKLPLTLSEVLASSGCHFFLEAMRKANRLQGANSITILAPNDNAFHSGILEATAKIIPHLFCKKLAARAQADCLLRSTVGGVG